MTLLSVSGGFHVLESIGALCVWSKHDYNHGLYGPLRDPARKRLGAACLHTSPDALLCTQLPLPEVTVTTARSDCTPPCLLPRGPRLFPVSPLSWAAPLLGCPRPLATHPLQTVWVSPCPQRPRPLLPSAFSFSLPPQACASGDTLPGGLRPAVPVLPVCLAPLGGPCLPCPSHLLQGGPLSWSPGVPAREITCECPRLIQTGALTGHICHLTSAQSSSAEALGRKCETFLGRGFLQWRGKKPGP